MINRIKALFAAPEGASVEAHSVDEIQLAAAALLVEAACLDESYDAVERDAIAHAVKQEFELSDAECETLIQEAEAAQHDATDLHRFIRKFDANFGHAERLRLIEMLWQVVYADGELHAYESNLIRRIGGMLHVTDRERSQARQRVLAAQ
ncbi:MAG: TerB family tellurite resistance protein [Alphaproteobacteria bacterium]|jgi:uncharacterized tellurite resistance protein B-like protein|nr:TerB family tellurite resistance protein [Alphaproteobacteria bacterium]MDP6590171.1 TerB family tellurite resistance protein [Alphaproteobacteria bacterium]MDP6818744.1 TerB family tellurite resistance protein [Alphaproteobacteria bacterium]|tara:strand:- start:2501 stop:2950 length:450 start_codon:yes stop_codon:yes gene_type:complete